MGLALRRGCYRSFGCPRNDNIATIAACGGAVNAGPKCFKSPNYQAAAASVSVQFQVYISFPVTVFHEVASE
jgi:hypothetical protein